MMIAELMEVRQKLRVEIETRSKENSKLQAQVLGLIEERTTSRQIRALSTSLQYHLTRLFPTLKFSKYAYSCTFDNIASHKG
jgi:putative heme iron utilization protein